MLQVNNFSVNAESRTQMGRRDGKLAKHVASVPLAESVPIWGVPTGPREFQSRSTAPATRS